MEHIDDARESDGVHAAIGSTDAIVNDLDHAGTAEALERLRCLILPTHLHPPTSRGFGPLQKVQLLQPREQLRRPWWRCGRD